MWAFLGIVLSAAWLGAVYWWFREYYGLENVEFMLPGEIGQMLAGIAAPLALIWIVVGYLRNGASLRRVSDELVDLREAARQRIATRPEPTPRLATASPPVHHPVSQQPAAPAPTAPPPLRPVPAERPPVVAAPPPPTPLPLGIDPDTAMLPTRSLPPGPVVERQAETAGAGALAEEVARNLERLEAGKPPQPSPAVAPLAVREANAELDPELQTQLHRVARDLNAISMDLSAVLCRRGARDDALKSYNRGHKEAFHLLVRDYLARHEPAEILSRLAQADATSLLHTYAVKFASLLDEAKRHDASGNQEQALLQSALGQLYGEVMRHTSATRGPVRA